MFGASLVWCSALCFWHVKFYHIWHNSTFCICFIMQKKRVYHGRMLLESEPRRENVPNRRRIFILFSSVAAVFSTLEKFISKRVLSVFSHEFTSQHRPLLLTNDIRIKNTEASRKWIFKMNNKHFHTQNRHLLKHDGLVCKIYVLSFNSPLHHRSLAGEEIMADMRVTPNHYWLLSFS